MMPATPLSRRLGADLRHFPWLAVGVAWIAYAIAQVVLARAGGSRVSVPLLLSVTLTRAVLWVGLTAAISTLALVVRDHRRWVIAVAHATGFAFAVGADAAVRRGLSTLVGSPPTIPFAATALYFADVTLVAYLGACVLGLMAHSRRVLRARDRQLLALRRELSTARLRWLETQLRPHFLFNTLSVVLEQAEESPRTAAGMLRKLVRLLKSATALGGEPELPLREELAILDAYLDLQRLRFADWLTIDTRIAPEALDARIPRFLLQPLVENAIGHGLRGRSERGRVEVVAEVRGDRLRIEVLDDGVGLGRGSQPRGAGRGIGLSNVRGRLETLYGDDYALTLDDLGPGGRGGGAATRIELPFRPAHVEAPACGEIVDVVPPPPRVALGSLHRYPVATTALVWLAWGVIWSTQSIAYSELRQRLDDLNLIDILRRDLSSALIWAALTPLIVWLARSDVLARRSMGIVIPVLATAGIGSAIAHAALFAALNRRGIDLSLFTLDLLTYAVIVLYAHGHRWERWAHERELAADETRTRLAEVELDATTRGLDTDSVTATLERAAESIETDRAGAERLLMQLADELRAALESFRERTSPAVLPNDVLVEAR
jgi:two-component system LytT family sensor kinase